MELNVIDFAKTKSGAKHKVDSDFLSHAYNEDLIHQVVTSYMAAARQGSKANKNRSAVRGGGAKPWRQKGTGRARAGTKNSPIWRSGGVTFAASPRDYGKKVNRKMYRGAMRSILSELARSDRLQLVSNLAVKEPKTKEVAARLKQLELDDVLIVDKEIGENLFLAARNIPNVGLCDLAAIDPLSLVSYDKVLISAEALAELEEKFK